MCKAALVLQQQSRPTLSGQLINGSLWGLRTWCLWNFERKNPAEFRHGASTARLIGSMSAQVKPFIVMLKAGTWRWDTGVIMWERRGLTVREADARRDVVLGGQQHLEAAASQHRRSQQTGDRWSRCPHGLSDPRARTQKTNTVRSKNPRNSLRSSRSHIILLAGCGGVDASLTRFSRSQQPLADYLRVLAQRREFFRDERPLVVIYSSLGLGGSSLDRRQAPTSGHAVKSLFLTLRRRRQHFFMTNSANMSPYIRKPDTIFWDIFKNIFKSVAIISEHD